MNAILTKLDYRVAVMLMIMYDTSDDFTCITKSKFVLCLHLKMTLLV